MKALTAYFSAESGRTAKVAKDLAEAVGSDLFEIVPEAPYTKADLNWRNPLARCNREWFGKKEVPAAGKVAGMADYDTVFLGFPIWYACAPAVINSFCKAHDWTGKKLYIFATSGGSGIGKTAEKLQPFVGGAKIVDARRVGSAAELKDWVPEG